MEQEKKQPEAGSGKCSLYAVLLGSALVLWLWAGGKNHSESQTAPERCLSAWDGSHPEMSREVKAMLNDPESFDHIETRYIDRGNEIDLIMKFKGTNKLGGVVTNTAKATINKDCNLVAGPIIL